MNSQQRSRAPEAPDVLRAEANALDDPEKDEMLDLMHSAEFRSLTSNDGQVDFFGTSSTVSNGTQLLVSSKNQNLLAADGRTRVGSRNPTIKSLNLETDKKQCPSSVEVRQFASSLRKERTHYDIECSRHWWASFKNRHPTLAHNSWLPWKAHGVRSRPRK
jgi:hypothetical protein